MPRLEPIGGVNKGKALFEIPADHPLPEILKRHEFRARRVYWVDFAHVDKEFLMDAVKKMGKEGLGDDYDFWLDQAKLEGGRRWHMLIVNGRDTRRTGMRSWSLNLLVPPWYEFDTGQFRIAFLKSSRDARTFRIPGIIVGPIAKSARSWEEFEAEKKQEHPGDWDKDLTQKFKEDYKATDGMKPYRWYGGFIPKWVTPTERKAWGGIMLSVFATAAKAEASAVAAAKVPGLEATVAIDQVHIHKQDIIMQDQATSLSNKTLENQELTGLLEEKNMPAIVRARPQPAAKVVADIISEGPGAGKKKGEPGLPKSIAWLALFLIGLAAMVSGNTTGIAAGATMITIAAGLFYLDYVRNENKKSKAPKDKKGEKGPVERGVEDLTGKSQGTSGP